MLGRTVKNIFPLTYLYVAEALVPGSSKSAVINRKVGAEAMPETAKAPCEWSERGSGPRGRQSADTHRHIKTAPPDPGAALPLS